MTAVLPCVSPLFCKIVVPKVAILSPDKFTINCFSASVILVALPTVLFALRRHPQPPRQPRSSAHNRYIWLSWPYTCSQPVLQCAWCFQSWCYYRSCRPHRSLLWPLRRLDLSSRKLAASNSLITHIDDISTAVTAITASVPEQHQLDLSSLVQHKQDYHDRKISICSSSLTTFDSLALQDGSSVQVLYHPTHGTIYVDNSIEQRYDLLTSLLLSPKPGQTIPPWSRPIDTVAPEEFDTPDPTSFPDDILTYLTTTHDEAIIVYFADLETQVTPGIKIAYPGIIDLLASDLALSVFVPTEWTGIKLEPYTLDVKPNIPAFLKARARPIGEALYRDAKAEFDRMRTYFYAPSTSTIASPLVVASKATAPFIRLCGDNHQINPFICIPQEPIPHVQQTLAKAAGWKFFVDLDMTNSFHHTRYAEFTLALCLYTMGSVEQNWSCLGRQRISNQQL